MRLPLIVASVVSHALVAASVAAQGTAPGCDVRGSHQWLSTRASPLDSTSLVLDGTVAKICYSRPSARGRSIDSLVPPGRAWRTGANEPTTLAVTGRLNIGGAVLAPGRYVLLAVPREDQWTLVFHTTSETEPGKMFANLKPVATGTGPATRLAASIEQFTIRAIADSVDPAFVLEWGRRSVRVPVRRAP